MSQASQNKGQAQPATCGRLILGAYTRLQSSPSNSAANCAADSRMTPSLTAGHLNLAPSSRAVFERRGDEGRAHRMRRVAAIEPERAGVFPDHAVDRVG